MSEFRVDVSDLASDDLLAIWKSIARHDAGAADRVLFLLDERINSLYEMPERGSPRPDVGRGIRVLMEGKYLIIYKTHKSMVRILRVLHGARDLTRFMM